ncbi:TMV resistance protein N-like [Eucalyptus grandis]|uniref:TMV resistance protein N-like n=1 Tax=Eucalyptus grandis TaxID=71139 RepID=UPI00192ECDDB|nr:TMV resistance protein N-like [Eucalyptus grandis]
MDFNGSLALNIIFALTVGLVLRQLTKQRDSESTSRTDDASAEENEASRRDSEPTSRTDDASAEENEALRRDSEPTSRTDDASAEENEALRRDSESTSRTDHESGEENEGFDSLGIEHKDSDTIDQMERMGTEPAYQYDVFLSFCGGDTRLTFTDILYERLKYDRIRVFLDSEELKKGKKISEILKAIDESQIYIPIFSKKFASRSWCLREVARMVECHSKSDGKREIIPIFYDVEPNDVKLISDVYKNDILKHKQKEYRKPEELEQWTRALKAVGSIMGLELKGKRQGKEIESLVKQVLHKLNGQHVDLPGNLVEDHCQIKAIIEKLDLNSGGVRFIIIRGLGGIGKTTLAKIVFKRLSSLFECVSFLEEVRKKSEDGLKGLVTLQKQLLKDANFFSADQIEDAGEGKYRIKAVCKDKKVLLVLDDLDNEKQLDNLAGKSDWFGCGSRIIITTRNKFIPETQDESSSEEVLNQTKKIVDYEVQDMEIKQALRLFCKHAFRNNSPTKDYDALSQDIVRKVAKLPLAIEAIGSDLYVLGLAKKPYGVTIELLQETLQKLDEGPPEVVQKVLMISYKGLEEKTKEVFLDIACFFINEDQTYPIIMWNDLNYQPDSAIRVLLLRSLIKIRDNKFWMHDQVRDLGRHIILKEHTPKFSRVWKHEDAVELLKRKEGNGDVVALSLTSNEYYHNFVDVKLVAPSELRFLRVKGSNFSRNFMNLPSKLKWLSWQVSKMTFQTKNSHLSNLVVLDFSESDITDDWSGWSQMKMNKLKVLDLTGCIHLKRTPNFSNFTSLETLILARCIKLTTIDSSIGKLKSLRTFNINKCMVLQELPVEFGSLQSLTEIIMPQNYQQFKLPDTFGNLQSLSSLILDEHPRISELPNSIGRLEKITRLSLCLCMEIKEIPYSIGGMKELAELDLSNSGIVKLPDSIRCLGNLKVIKVNYTPIEKFPCTIGEVKMLEELHAKKCRNLMDENIEEIGKLSRLRKLDISYTGVSRFPTVLGRLTNLQTLEMSSSHLQEVPYLPSSLKRLHMQAPHFPSIPDLSSLVNLDHLELSKKTGSMEEPDMARTNDWPEEELIYSLPSSLSSLIFRGINLLPPFSNLSSLSEMSISDYSKSRFSVSQDLKHLRKLKLSTCNLLEEICGLSLLTNLKCLDLNRLKSLVEIRDLLELKLLEHLRIAHCKKIERLPNFSKLDKLRRIELEAFPKIGEIEGIKGIESLTLDPRGCTILERLSDDPRSTWLSRRIPMYDVFLSFERSDTRNSIIDILYNNLLRNKILVFKEPEELIVSAESSICAEFLSAVNDSHIYIPFLSKRYIYSTWCLHELACILEHAKSDGKRILPIFYDVEVKDVKLKTKLCRTVLDKHRKKMGLSNMVKAWEEALRYVGDMDGYNLQTRSLGEVIELVTEEVSRELLLLYADARRPQEAED